jgi:hypothetical protein
VAEVGVLLPERVLLLPLLLSTVIAAELLVTVLPETS